MTEFRRLLFLVSRGLAIVLSAYGLVSSIGMVAMDDESECSLAKCGFSLSVDLLMS